MDSLYYQSDPQLSHESQPTQDRHLTYVCDTVDTVAYGGLGHGSEWKDVSSIRSPVYYAPYGDTVFDFSNLTASENDARITSGPSVTGSIVDPPFKDHVNSWADRSQATAVYDPFSMALFNDEFGIYDHSMGMVNDLNHLHATTGFGRMSMQHVNPGSAHLNGAFDIPDLGPNFVCDDHDQLTNATIPTTIVLVPTRAPAATPTTRSMHLHRCNFPTCTRRFKRPSDLARHQYTVHLNVQGHHCPIVGCPKARGKGYSRADKVTEHLWRKHGDLGYVKARG
ncbi:hypothetical protein BGW36DRAFT_411763 [Talaromyces proteolyticus]|uniref:C2H2-type domain-containing protein n=1 Tax=Talaromyces proteolyticus TaxID=1131652 RepID=A0AAD4KFC2_9EURO|nr:uncharacterized protein BGW36DRAFT_411763 [Talaromyces proteolyticus]KAH8689843.1 hypothetical protein BGW36DRAFT_411763 [Talaromyces proteolyticus]